MIKYPNGIVKNKNNANKTKLPNKSKANLGISFENLINESNLYYLQNNIACIYKKPTPIQIVKVEYPTRSKARITEAYYKTPSTTDYNGIYKGKYVDFEAKSVKGTNFPFSNIYPHQIKHLETIHNMGGISFLLIEFSSKNEVYLLPTPYLLDIYKKSLIGERKSIPYEYFKEYGILIKFTYNPIVDYIKAIDIYIENKKAA